jgi:hypothetical protein
MQRPARRGAPSQPYTNARWRDPHLRRRAVRLHVGTDWYAGFPTYDEVARRVEQHVLGLEVCTVGAHGYSRVLTGTHPGPHRSTLYLGAAVSLVCGLLTASTVPHSTL